MHWSTSYSHWPTIEVGPYRFWQNGRWWPFWKKNQKKMCALIWNGEKCNQKCGHFVKNTKKNLKFCIDKKWREMRLKVILGHVNKNYKIKSCVLIWNNEKCVRKWFSVIQNGRRRRFCVYFCRNSFNISFSPCYMGEHEHPNHHIVARPQGPYHHSLTYFIKSQIIILSLAPKARFTHLWQSL